MPINNSAREYKSFVLRRRRALYREIHFVIAFRGVNGYVLRRGAGLGVSSSSIKTFPFHYSRDSMPHNGVKILANYFLDGTVAEAVDIFDNETIEYNFFHGASSLKEDKGVMKSLGLLGWKFSDLLLSKKTGYNGISYCRAFKEAYEEEYDKGYQRRDVGFLRKVMEKVGAKKEKYEPMCPKSMNVADLRKFLEGLGFKESGRRET